MLLIELLYSCLKLGLDRISGSAGLSGRLSGKKNRYGPTLLKTDLETVKFVAVAEDCEGAVHLVLVL